MDIFIQVMVFVFVGAWFVNRIISANQRANGQRRCKQCRARLKFMGVGVAAQHGVKAGFASRCSKCGAIQ